MAGPEISSAPTLHLAGRAAIYPGSEEISKCRRNSSPPSGGSSRLSLPNQARRESRSRARSAIAQFPAHGNRVLAGRPWDQEFSFSVVPEGGFGHRRSVKTIRI